MALEDIEAGLGLSSLPFISGLGKAGSAMSDFVSKVRASASGLGYLVGIMGRVYHAAMSVAKILLTVGIIIAAIASVITVKAIRAFSQFQRGMQEVASIIPGVLVPQIVQLGQELLILSRKFGLTADSAVKAAYNLSSAGFSVNETIMVLYASSISAIAGLTTIEAAARLTAATLRSYGLGIESLTDVQDTLFMTVRLGVLTFQDLVDNLGTVMPMAVAAGISLEHVGAMVALITQRGIPANEAITALNRLLTQLAAPTATARERMKELGIVTHDVFGNMLTDIAVLKQFEGLTLTQLRGIIGEIRGIKGILALINQPGLLAAAFEKMAGKTGAAMEAMEKQIQTLSHRWGRMSALSKSVWITLGAMLEPIGQSFIRVLATIGLRLLSWIETNRAAIENFASVVADKMELVSSAFIGMFKGISFNYIISGFTKVTTVVQSAIPVLSGLATVAAVLTAAFLHLAWAQLLVVRAMTLYLKLATLGQVDFINSMDSAIASLSSTILDTATATYRAGTAFSAMLDAIAAGGQGGLTTIDELIYKESEYIKKLRERFALEKTAREEAETEEREAKKAEAAPTPGTPEFQKEWKDKMIKEMQAVGYTADAIAAKMIDRIREEVRITAVQRKLEGKYRTEELAARDNDRKMEITEENKKEQAIFEAHLINAIKLKETTEAINLLDAQGELSDAEQQEKMLLKEKEKMLKKERKTIMESRKKAEKERTAQEKTWTRNAGKRASDADKIAAVRARKDAEELVKEKMQLEDAAEKKRMRKLEEETAASIRLEKKELQEKQALEAKAFRDWKGDMLARVRYFKQTLSKMQADYKRLVADLKQIDASRRAWIEGQQDRMFEYTMSRSDAATRLEKRRERAKYFAKRAMATDDMEARRGDIDKAIAQQWAIIDGEEAASKERKDRIRKDRQDGKISRKEERSRLRAEDKASRGRRKLAEADIHNLTKLGAESFDKQERDARAALESIGKNIEKASKKIKELYAFVKKNVLEIKANDTLKKLHDDAQKLLNKLNELAGHPGFTGEPRGFSAPAVSRQHGGWIGANLLTRLHQGEFVVRREAAVQNARLLESLNRSRAPVQATTNLEGTFNFPGVSSLDTDTVRSRLIPELERFRRHRIGS